MYNNYIFDMYGTLVDIKTNEYSNNFWSKIKEFYCFRGAEYTTAQLKKRYSELCQSEEKKLSQYDYPEIEIEKVFKSLFNEKGIEISDDEIKVLGEFFRIISTRHIRLYDGVIDFLEDLKKKGKKIYLLSNAQKVFTEPEIKYLKIWDYFDGILISSVEQCKKPSKAFFEKLIDRYDIDISKSIMIGNDGTSDIEGANSVGMDSLYIKTDISPLNEKAENVNATYKIPDGDFRKISPIILK